MAQLGSSQRAYAAIGRRFGWSALGSGSNEVCDPKNSVRAKPDLWGRAALQQVMADHVIDLRGQGAHTGRSSVLADPTGRRRRWLTLMGRIVTGTLILWICGLVGAGLGLLPAPIVPFVSVVGPQSSPPRLDRLPSPRPPSPALLRPAARARSTPRAAGRPIGDGGSPHARTRARSRPVSSTLVRNGFGGLTAAPLVSAQNALARSATGTPGNSGAAKGLGTTRRSESASGQSPGTSTATTTTRPPGASESAPGHTESAGHGKTPLAPQS